MPTVRFRLTGATDRFTEMIAMLEGLPHVDRVEEVGDLMGGMRDDSSSADLPDDDSGDAHEVEVHAGSDPVARHVRNMVEERAMELGVVVEFVEEF
jgi:hypothetical protein